MKFYFVASNFLALTSSVASSLVELNIIDDKDFVGQTVLVTTKHLMRWGDITSLRHLDKLLAAKLRDVKRGSSNLFFTDKHLWMIAIYADLAGVLWKESRLWQKVSLSGDQLILMRNHFSRLLNLLAVRTTITSTITESGKKAQLAELDRGFWWLHDNNKYANYTGSVKPVICVPKEDGTYRKKVSVSASALSPARELGWDFSHSRRLVHVFDAIERNRHAIQMVFGIAEVDLPTVSTMQAFARQLIENLWNGSYLQPLFRNYWSGNNGWYRVAYNNGTSRCTEGYPPFGLTESFITGGYVTWAGFVPEIRILGRRLYWLSESDDDSNNQFLDRYYSGLGEKVSSGKRMLTKLMFWPTLIENAQ